MFCEPNLKNRDNIEAIKKSVSLPDTYRAETVALVGPVRTGRGCLPQESVKGQKFVLMERRVIRSCLEFMALRR
jgi:hypothetical protein